MGLLLVIGLGVYGETGMKDFVCSSRPLALPVTHLSEYLVIHFLSTDVLNAIMNCLVLMSSHTEK